MTNCAKITSIDDARSALENNSQDRLARAKQWQQQGGKVIGYVSNTIPIELIHAANMLPLHLVGEPKSATPLADQFLEPAFDPLSRSLFERILRGDYNFLDGIVLPRTHDAYQRLYYYLCEIERKHSHYTLPPVYLLNLLHTHRPSTDRFNQQRFMEFNDFLGEIGIQVTEEKCRASVQLYNALRQELALFNRHRANALTAPPSKLSYDIYAAAQSLPAEEYLSVIKIINAHLASPGTEPSQDYLLRLVIAGNGVDHVGLHELCDSLKVAVVGDYHSLGNHFLDDNAVATSGNMILNLAQHYQYHCISGRSFHSHAADVANFAQKQQADAVLFHYLLKEEALSWHFPKQQRAITAAGMAVRELSDQPYSLQPNALQAGAIAVVLQSLIDERK